MKAAKQSWILPLILSCVTKRLAAQNAMLCVREDDAESLIWIKSNVAPFNSMVSECALATICSS